MVDLRSILVSLNLSDEIIQRFIDQNPPKAEAVRCVITGDSNIGKSTLAVYFSEHRFLENYEETVFDHFSESVTVKRKSFTVGIFDTSGQLHAAPNRRDLISWTGVKSKEKSPPQIVHTELRQFCYDNSEVLLVAYSVLNRESFNHARDIWLPEAVKYKKKYQRIILIGLQHDKWIPEKHGLDVVSNEEGRVLAIKFNIKSFLECSSLTDCGVDDIFIKTVKLALKQRQKRCSFKRCFHFRI